MISNTFSRKTKINKDESFRDRKKYLKHFYIQFDARTGECCPVRRKW